MAKTHVLGGNIQRNESVSTQIYKKGFLRSEFFDKKAPVVARDLLGKYLVRKIGNNVKKYRIVETEAYEGLLDKASHASRGETPRNKPMFGKPGTIYVYFTYGMHWMLNIVCDKVGHPAAVLIRGVEDCIGPGRLTKKLKINKDLNNKSLGKKSGLWIEEDKHTNIRMMRMKRMTTNKILKTPRIGVNYAGPIWSKKLYRFVLQ